MALSATQKLAIKKHLNYDPFTIQMDQTFTAMDANADMLAELQDCLTACDTALTAVSTAETAADEIVSGGGANIDHNRNISTKTAAYNRQVANLSRIMGFPVLEDEVESSTTTGWFGE